MTLNRLDNVLARTRTNMMSDLVLVAFLFGILLLSGVAVSQALPRLYGARPAAAVVEGPALACPRTPADVRLSC